MNVIGEDLMPVIPPVYWLDVCNAFDAIDAFLRAPKSNSEDLANIIKVVEHHHILALPEFPSTISKFGDLKGGEKAGHLFIKLAEQLSIVQEDVLRKYPYYGEILGNLAFDLSAEEKGVKKFNLWRAIQLFQEAGKHFPAESLGRARCLRGEGMARRKLADTGVNVKSNLSQAIIAFTEVCKILPPNTHEFAVCLENHAFARVVLAQIGFDPRMNSEQAIQLCTQARDILQTGTNEYVISFALEANALKVLAGLGIDREANLEKAAALLTKGKLP